MDTDKVIESLAAFTEYEPDDISESYDYAYGKGKVFEVGSREYLVFADDEDADDGATEYLTEMLENEPELFVQDWLQSHLTMRPGDISIIASEDADSYADDIDEERAIEEADMEDDVEESISAARKAFDDAQDAYMNAEPGSEEEDEASEAQDEAEEALDAARAEAIEKIADLARDKIREDLAEQYEDEMRSDPISFFQDRGYEVKDAIDRGFLVIDVEAAAEDALSTDGRAHFLSTYDGNEEEIEGGFIVFRIN